jgi:hypothetical protein
MKWQCTYISGTLQVFCCTDNILPLENMFHGGFRWSRRLVLSKRSLATHAALTEKPCSSITPPYSTLIQQLERVRRILRRPLTLAEKILYSHLIDPEKSLGNGRNIRGEAYLQLRPERVAMQDASAQYVCVIPPEPKLNNF